MYKKGGVFLAYKFMMSNKKINIWKVKIKKDLFFYLIKDIYF